MNFNELGVTKEIVKKLEKENILVPTPIQEKASHYYLRVEM